MGSALRGREAARAGEPATNFRLKRAFWLHVLAKYGYITRVP
jgi:hypothetical protein